MISEKKQQRIETMDRLLKILNDRVFADDPLKSDRSGYCASSNTYKIYLSSDGYEFVYNTYTICEIKESELDLDTIEQYIKNSFIDLCKFIDRDLSRKIDNIQYVNDRLHAL